ncbi:MAG TPA: Pycsar system effector family protein [Actinocrinis sp.]|jgi:hypothetical protein|uniref:Pycsar system effector family protein n=1 Tax=Actinocrinis sp. TaxID=1920516 RepID=UPI002DDD8B39|nr:Pycsar system effector family protein [Actinocrinis sp.]HEV3169261.1 Pycsar system effector family protein [Actinocrinis sp.]
MSKSPALPAVPRYLVEQAERAIDRADTKAATLAAVALAILPSAVRSAASAHGPSAAALPQVLFSVSVLTWGAGVAALAAAILPRLRHTRTADGDQLASFCDLPAKFDLERLRALVDRTNDDAELWLLVQSHVLGRIAVAKYRMIRIGMSLIAFAALCGACAALVS